MQPINPNLPSSPPRIPFNHDMEITPAAFKEILKNITVSYKDSGLAKCSVAHGTGASQIKSVLQGPKNLGQGNGASGLYVALDEDRVAASYADNKARLGGGEHVVMKGSFNPNRSTSFVVGRLTIAATHHGKHQPLDLYRGIWPGDWHKNGSLKRMMQEHFDIVMIYEAATHLWVNRGEGRYAVIYNKAGKDAVDWHGAYSWHGPYSENIQLDKLIYPELFVHLRSPKQDRLGQPFWGGAFSAMSESEVIHFLERRNFRQTEDRKYWINDRGRVPLTVYLNREKKEAYLFRKTPRELPEVSAQNRAHLDAYKRHLNVELERKRITQDDYKKMFEARRMRCVDHEKNYKTTALRIAYGQKPNPSPFRPGGRALGPGGKQFTETVQKTGLTKEFSLSAKGSSSGKIGGVGCTRELMENLFDKPDVFFDHEHMFYVRNMTDRDRFHVTNEELQQLLRELTIGIYQGDAVPVFSLHFNQVGNLFPVIHPIYEKTLVGQVISMLDYMMKGFLHGYMFREDEIKDWKGGYSFLNGLIDLTCTYEVTPELSLITYRSLHDSLGQKFIEKDIFDEPECFRDFSKFTNSFRIIAKHKSVQKESNLFVLDWDFDVLYTIEPDALYKARMAEFILKNGKSPKAFQCLEAAFEEMSHKIHDEMPKLPNCRKYFAMLGLINFFSNYLMTLKKHQKVPVLPALLAMQKRTDYGCPAVFPNYPLMYIEAVENSIKRCDMLAYESFVRHNVGADYDHFNMQWLRNRIEDAVRHPEWYVNIRQNDERNKIVGGCGVTLSPMKVIPSERGEALFQEHFAALKEVGAETWTKLPDHDNGAVFKLAFEDRCPDAPSDYEGIEDLLVHSGSKLNLENVIEECELQTDLTHLLDALYFGDKAGFEYLLRNCDLDKIRDREGRSLLHYTAMQEDPYYTNALLPFLKDLPSSLTSLEDKQEYTPAHYAAMHGRLEQVKILKKLNHKPFYVEYAAKGVTPFLVAIQHGQRETVKELRKGHDDINFMMTNGYSPLLCAIHHGYVEIALDLLQDYEVYEKPMILDGFDGQHKVDWFERIPELWDKKANYKNYKADPNLATREGVTPLMLACELGSEVLVRKLLEKGANARARRLLDGMSALQISIKKGHLVICEILLPVSDVTLSTVELAIRKGSLDILKLLLRDPNNLVNENVNGETALSLAIRQGNIPAALYILSLMTKKEDLQAAFKLALDAGLLELAEAIIQKGIVVDTMQLLIALCRFGDTPMLRRWMPKELAEADLQKLLLAALQAGQPIIISQFLEPRRVNLDAFQTPNGWRMEHYLAKADGIWLLRKRLSRRNDFLQRLPEAQGGNTLPYIAAENGSWKVLRYFLAEKAIPLENHFLGRHLLYGIIERGELGSKEEERGVELFFKYSQGRFQIDQPLDNRGTRAVHVAAQQGSKKILMLLRKEHKANMNSADSAGFTPLYFAIRSGSAEAVAYLLSDECRATITPEAAQLALRLPKLEKPPRLAEACAKLPNQSPDDHNSTPLHSAASKNNGELQQLLASGQHSSDINKRDQSGNTPLFHAIRGGHENVLSLLQAGADPNCKNYQLETPLIVACKWGGLNVVECLLKYGADINQMGTVDGVSPLYLSLMRDEELALCLILKGANCNVVAHTGDTIAHMAARKGRKRVFRFLVAKKTSFDNPNEKGFHPIHIAAFEGHVKILSQLKDRGVSLDTPSRSPQQIRPLHLATSEGRVEAVKWLLDQKADPEAKIIGDFDKELGVIACAARDNCRELLDIFKQYLLFKDPQQIPPAIAEAINKDYFNTVAALYELGIPLHAEIINGLTGLHLACASGALSTTTHFLNAGVDPTIQTQSGETPLELAATNPSIGQFKRLIDASHPDLDAINAKGETLLHIAARSGNLTHVMLLIDLGASLNIQNHSGFTPLHLAAERGSTEIVELLLACGADFTKKTHFNGKLAQELVSDSQPQLRQTMLRHETLQTDSTRSQSQLHTAVKAQNPHAVTILSRLGGVDNQDEQGVTPLHLASELENLSIVRTLLRQGASVDRPDKRGYTALWKACLKGQAQMAKFLIKVGANRSHRNGEGHTLLSVLLPLEFPNKNSILELLN